MSVKKISHNTKCKNFIKAILEHEKVKKEIYKLIFASPKQYTELGKILGYDYYAIKRKLNLQILKPAELVKLLEYID